MDLRRAVSHDDFGDAIGDSVADNVLNSLRSRGPMPRLDIVNMFCRHIRKDRLDRVLKNLRESGLARVDQKKTNGRPAEIWSAVSTGAA